MVAGTIDVCGGCWRWPGVISSDIAQTAINPSAPAANDTTASSQEPTRFVLKLPTIRLQPGQLLLVKGPVGSGTPLNASY